MIHMPALYRVGMELSDFEKIFIYKISENSLAYMICHFAIWTDALFYEQMFIYSRHD